MTTPLIFTEDISLHVKGPSGDTVPILNNINLRVSKGAFVSITGASGSGKTSLLTVLSGLERVTFGRIVIAGQDITSKNEDALAAFRRDHIGIVFQNFHLIPAMNALENIAAGLELAGDGDAREKAEYALESVGLYKRMRHFPEQLSGGEQQRVALARAFVSRPDILLADEPTGNLDSENGARIMELLFRLKDDAGTTLLLVTHDNTLADQADKSYLMKDGTLTVKP